MLKTGVCHYIFFTALEVSPGHPTALIGSAILILVIQATPTPLMGVCVCACVCVCVCVCVCMCVCVAGIPPVTTCYKKAQLFRYSQLMTSRDSNCRLLAESQHAWDTGAQRKLKPRGSDCNYDGTAQCKRGKACSRSPKENCKDQRGKSDHPYQLAPWQKTATSLPSKRKIMSYGTPP